MKGLRINTTRLPTLSHSLKKSGFFICLYVLKVYLYNMKRIQTTIHIDEDVKQIGLKDAYNEIGTRNLSAYITFLIKKNHNK